MSQTIGVDSEIIEMFFRQENLDIPRTSKYYLECEKCGCSIREGKFCSFCIREITGGIRGLIDGDIKKTMDLRMLKWQARCAL